MTAGNKTCLERNEVWTNCTACDCRETVCAGYDTNYTAYNGSFGECLCKSGYERDLDTNECVLPQDCSRIQEQYYDFQPSGDRNNGEVPEDTTKKNETAVDENHQKNKGDASKTQDKINEETGGQ